MSCGGRPPGSAATAHRPCVGPQAKCLHPTSAYCRAACHTCSAGSLRGVAAAEGRLHRRVPGPLEGRRPPLYWVCGGHTAGTDACFAALHSTSPPSRHSSILAPVGKAAAWAHAQSRPPPGWGGPHNRTCQMARGGAASPLVAVVRDDSARQGFMERVLLPWLVDKCRPEIRCPMQSLCGQDFLTNV